MKWLDLFHVSTLCCVHRISHMKDNNRNSCCSCYLAVVEVQYTVTVSEKPLVSFCKSRWYFFHFRLYAGDIFNSLHHWVMQMMQMPICICKLCSSTHKSVNYKIFSVCLKKSQLERHVHWTFAPNGHLSLFLNVTFNAKPQGQIIGRQNQQKVTF